MTLDDLRFTAVLKSPLCYGEIILRLLKLLGLYLLLSLSGAVLFFLAKIVIALIAAPVIATLVVSLLCGCVGALVSYRWLAILLETPHSEERSGRFREFNSQIRLARWPTLLLGFTLSISLSRLLASSPSIDMPDIPSELTSFKIGLSEKLFFAYLVIHIGLGGLLESGERLRNAALHLLQLFRVIKVEGPGERGPDA